LGLYIAITGLSHAGKEIAEMVAKVKIKSIIEFIGRLVKLK
jgi:hypothetical protein